MYTDLGFALYGIQSVDESYSSRTIQFIALNVESGNLCWPTHHTHIFICSFDEFSENPIKRTRILELSVVPEFYWRTPGHRYKIDFSQIMDRVRSNGKTKPLVTVAIAIAAAAAAAVVRCRHCRYCGRHSCAIFMPYHSYVHICIYLLAR